MAIRSVVINVATNAAQVGGSFQALAAATREVGAANEASAVAAKEAEAAEFSLAMARARGATTANEEAAALARLDAATGAAVAATEKEAAAQDMAAQARMRAGRTIGMIGLALSGTMVYGFVKSIEAAGQWQEKMQQVAIAGNLTAAGTKLIGDSLLDLSTRMPISANALADAFAVIERQGHSGAAAMEILRQSGQAAAIGLGDVTSVARNVMAVMDAYSTQGVTAGQVTNMLTAAFLHGQGDIDHFAKSLAQVAPVAGLAQVPLDHVVAALAAMTKEGLNTQQAAMALNRFMLQVINPTSDLDKAMRGLKDSTGNFRYESGAAALKAEGLGGVMADLMSITHGNVAELERLYPSVRAFRGVAALAADDGRNFSDSLKLMSDNTALAAMQQDAYQKQQSTFASQMTLAKNNMHQLSVEAGQVLLPFINDLVKSVQGLIQWFTGMPGPIKTAAVAGAALAAVIALLASSVLILAPGLAAVGGAGLFAEGGFLAAAMGAVGLEAALGPLLLILLPIVAVLGVLGFAIMTAAKHSAEGKQAVKEYGDAWESAAQGTQGAVQAHAQAALVAEGAAKRIKELGLSIDAVNNIISSSRAAPEFKATQDQIIQSSNLTTEALKKQGYTQEEINRVHKDVGGALAGSKHAYEDLKTTVITHSAAMGENNKKQQEGIKALGDIRKETDRSNQGRRLAIQHEKDYAEAQARAAGEIRATGHISATTAQSLKDLDITTDKLTDDQKAVQTAFKNWTDVASVVKAAKDAITGDMKGFEDASNVLSDVVQAGQDAASKAAEKQAKDFNEGLHDENRELSQNISDMQFHSKQHSTAMSTIAQTNVHNAKYQASQVKEANHDMQKSAADFKTTYVANAADFIKGLQKTSADTDQWRKDLLKISQAGYDDLAKALRKMGKEGVPLAHEFATGTVAAMKTASDAIKNLGDDADVSFEQFAAGLKSQISDMQKWQQNLVGLAQHGMSNLARKFVEMGPQGAKAAQGAMDQIDAGLKSGKGIPKAVADLNESLGQVLDLSKPETAKAFSDMLDELPNIASSQGEEAANRFVDNLVQSMHLDPTQAQSALNQIARDLEQGGQANVALELRIAGAKQGMDTGVPAYGSTNPLGGWGGHHHYGFAGGGIVKYFAEGHHAEIAPSGVTRVWNEPEAGGEAYIPLSPTKAGRSTAIWREVGRILGSHNDDGNMYPAGSAMVMGGAPTWQPVYAPPTPAAERPTSRTVEYNFTGPIHGYNLEMVQRDADRKARLTALGGGAGLGAHP